MVPQANGSFARLAARLHRDKMARLMLEFLDRFRDAHLKLLSVDELSDRRRLRVRGREVWNFGSDSFLGLDRDPRVQQAIAEALPRWGTHNGASRAFSSVALCDEVERRLARWLGVPDTLLFPSVTLANVGLLPALVMPGHRTGRRSQRPRQRAAGGPVGRHPRRLPARAGLL
jgi:7-keto-8-aminopelargonate synthetase-like enzyme